MCTQARNPCANLLNPICPWSQLQPAAGDVVLTGTPEGVGRLVPGDQVHAWVAEAGGSRRVLSEAHWVCVAAEAGAAGQAAAGAGAQGVRSRL